MISLPVCPPPPPPHPPPPHLAAEGCQRELSRGVRMALWAYKRGGLLTRVCDADVAASCPAVAKQPGMLTIGRCLHMKAWGCGAAGRACSAAGQPGRQSSVPMPPLAHQTAALLLFLPSWPGLPLQAAWVAACPSKWLKGASCLPPAMT